jgi:hypothetical protein
MRALPHLERALSGLAEGVPLSVPSQGMLSIGSAFINYPRERARAGLPSGKGA